MYLVKTNKKSQLYTIRNEDEISIMVETKHPGSFIISEKPTEEKMEHLNWLGYDCLTINDLIEFGEDCWESDQFEFQFSGYELYYKHGEWHTRSLLSLPEIEVSTIEMNNKLVTFKIEEKIKVSDDQWKELTWYTVDYKCFIAINESLDIPEDYILMLEGPDETYISFADHPEGMPLLKDTTTAKLIYNTICPVWEKKEP